jgi:hypothetical protein
VLRWIHVEKRWRKSLHYSLQWLARFMHSLFTGVPVRRHVAI